MARQPGFGLFAVKLTLTQNRMYPLEVVPEPPADHKIVASPRAAPRYQNPDCATCYLVNPLSQRDGWRSPVLEWVGTFRVYHG
ncbi:MAG: hypothetical protein WCA10_24710 [Terracidiphilus sp.]